MFLTFDFLYMDYTGLQNRRGSVQKIRILFSKVFRRAESKNGIRFGPTRHVFSQIEKILFGSEAKIGRNCKKLDKLK